MEIVEHSKNRAVVKTLSKIEPEEFDTAVRRSFQTLLTMAKESLLYLENNDFESLKSIVLMDQNINKHIDFCRRVLIKVGYKSYSKTSPIYVIAENIEKIGDVYRDLCNVIIEKKFKPNQNIIELYSLINNFLQGFYDLCYKFDIKSIDFFGKHKEKINKCLDT